MNKTIIMIMGPSGCGKSTLEQQILSYGNAKKIISVTTRPPRAGEVNGVDYHFIARDEFTTLVDDKELIQTTEFAGELYGSARSEYTTEHSIATLVVVPSSAKPLMDLLAIEYPNFDVKIVYFNITTPTLIANMRKRGDTNVMIEQRLANDDLTKQMESSGLFPNFTVTDDMLTSSLSSHLMQQILY